MAFRVGAIEVSQKPSIEFDTPIANYGGFHPSSTTLPRGHQKEKDRRAFDIDTIYDRDVGVSMRDGVVLRADIFRPTNPNETFPALVAWSPYGKTGTGIILNPIASCWYGSM